MTIMQDLESGVRFRFPGGAALFEVVEPEASFRSIITSKVYYMSVRDERVIVEDRMMTI